MFYLLVLVLTLIGSIIVGEVTEKMSFRKKEIRGFLVYRTSMILIIVLFVGSPLFYEYPMQIFSENEKSVAGSMVASTTNDGQIIFHPYGKFCIEFTDQCFNVPKKVIKIGSSVSPLTNNPKVRPIKYYVTAKIASPEIFYKKNPGAKSFWKIAGVTSAVAGDIVTERATYWLLEFNEANSKEISKFYNYLDETQQAEFKELVENWVNPKLAEEGIQISCNDFMVKEL